MIKRILSVAALATMLIAMLPMASCGNKTAETSEATEASADETKADQANGQEAADNLDETVADSSDSNPTDTNKPVKIKFKTTKGDFTVRLYDDTPLHRDNMVKLVKEHFYDGLLFHRVIKDFMVQGGDPDSKDAQPGQMLGSGDPGYTIPAEIRPNHFHTRYALAAARTGDQVNPERRSSGSQFYVVTGSQVDSTQLLAMAEQRVFNDLVQQNVDRIRQMQASGDMAGLQALQTEFEAKAKAEAANLVPAEVAKAYATVGGAPFLDGQYTVYGEVIDGFKAIDAIENVATGAADRPVDDVRIISASVVD